MANFEKIKDVVLTYADRYAKAFSTKATERFSGSPFSSGRLARSYRGVAEINQDKFSIKVYGEDYGIYQDSGIDGTQKQVPRAARSLYPPGKFKSETIGGTLPFGLRKHIADNGLTPQPFMQDAVDLVTPEFANALETAGVQDIENFFNDLSKIEVS